MAPPEEELPDLELAQVHVRCRTPSGRSSCTSRQRTEPLVVETIAACLSPPVSVDLLATKGKGQEDFLWQCGRETEIIPALSAACQAVSRPDMDLLSLVEAR